MVTQAKVELTVKCLSDVLILVKYMPTINVKRINA